MSEEDTGQMSARAEAFFERARKVAASNNYDYAIDMYLEGLRCEPDALERVIYRFTSWCWGGR